VSQLVAQQGAQAKLPCCATWCSSAAVSFVCLCTAGLLRHRAVIRSMSQLLAQTLRPAWPSTCRLPAGGPRAAGALQVV
jgi:hypothetical protein